MAGGAGSSGRVSGREVTTIISSHPWLHCACRRGLAISFVVSFVISLVCYISSWDRSGRSAKVCLECAATAQTTNRKRTAHNIAMTSIGHMRVMSNREKKCCHSSRHFTNRKVTPSRLCTSRLHRRFIAERAPECPEAVSPSSSSPFRSR